MAHLAALADGIIVANPKIMKDHFSSVTSALANPLTLDAEMIYNVDLAYIGDYE